MKVAASNINIKMHQLFSEQRILGVCLRDRSTAENLCGLHSNLLLNNVQTILVKITIKLILIFLSNSFHENEKQNMKCISFSIFL